MFKINSNKKRKSLPRTNLEKKKQMHDSGGMSFWNNIILSRFFTSKLVIGEIPKKKQKDQEKNFSIKTFFSKQKKKCDNEDDYEEKDEINKIEKKCNDEELTLDQKNEELTLDQKEWYFESKKFITRLLEINIGAIAFSKYLSSIFGRSPSFVCDIVQWIRDGRHNKTEVSFQPGPIGITYKGNLVVGVDAESQASRAGVCIGWRILSVNDRKITLSRDFVESFDQKVYSTSEAIESHISKLLKKDVTKNIVFGMEDSYAPLQDAILGMLVLTSLSCFLGSEYWANVKVELEKFSENLFFVCGNNVIIHVEKDTSSTPVDYLKRGAFVDGEQKGNWLHNSKGYIELRKDEKNQLIPTRKRKYNLSPLSDEIKKLLGVVFNLMILKHTTGENWIQQIKKIAPFIPVPITISDISLPDQELIFINSAFTAITEYHPKEVIGKNCRILQGPESSHTKNLVGRKVIKDSIANGEDCYVHLVNYTKSGRYFHNLLALKPIYNDARDAVQYMMGIQFDVGSLSDETIFTPDTVILKTMRFLKERDNDKELMEKQKKIKYDKDATM